MNYDIKTGTFYYWPWDKQAINTEGIEGYVWQYINMLNKNVIPLLSPRNICEYMTCGESHVICGDYIYKKNGLPMLDIEHLDNKSTIQSVNHLLHDLYDMSNHPQEYYDTFTISKRNGSIRTIYAPNEQLKWVQRWIVKYILSGFSVSDNAKAYKKSSTIVDNTKFHLDRPVVVKADISDFFGSIRLSASSEISMITRKESCIFDEYVYDEVTEKRTRSVLDVFLEIYSADVATFLANLCCQRGRLPQGAPTSPMLSNIVFHPLDKRIEAYCRYNGIAYTRYSDDMTFSGDFDVSHLLKTLRFILQDGGFALNDDKTRVLRRGQRQSITGIVVNKKLQVPRNYRKRIRQDMYYLKKFGVREHIQYRCRKQDRVCMRFVRGGRVYVKKYMQSVLGKINFVLSVNPKDKEFRQYKSDITFMLIVHKPLQTRNNI